MSQPFQIGRARAAAAHYLAESDDLEVRMGSVSVTHSMRGSISGFLELANVARSYLEDQS